MAEPTTLVEQKSRSLVAPGFLAIVAVLVLVRGLTSADTTGGTILVALLGGGLLALGGGLFVFTLRSEPLRLEIAPEHIVLWRRDAAGTRIGVTPPIVVQRRIVGGTNPTSIWVLHDASESAVDFLESGSTNRYGVDARIELHGFDPRAVFDAVQRAGWPAEWRT